MVAVFIKQLVVAELINKEWLKEAYPDAEPSIALSVINAAIQSPLGFVYGVFGERDKDIFGFFWGEGNVLDMSLFINTIYVCKSMRKNPKIIGEILDFLKNSFPTWGFKKILFMTKKPNFYLKRGCKVFEETCLQLDSSHGSAEVH